MLANNATCHVNAVAPTNLTHVIFDQNLQDCKAPSGSTLFALLLFPWSPLSSIQHLYWSNCFDSTNSTMIKYTLYQR